MKTTKPCTARCEPEKLTTDEKREGLAEILSALRENPDLARELAVLLRVAVEK
jgi:hypothetical protein